MIKFAELDRKDKQYLVGAVIAPLVVWWFFTARTKYSAKGMK